MASKHFIAPSTAPESTDDDDDDEAEEEEENGASAAPLLAVVVGTDGKVAANRRWYSMSACIEYKNAGK
jgi:hypothetical protein